MMKYFYRYAIYTAIICVIYTLLNSVHTQGDAAKWLNLKISTESIEKILPLILTILLIEVTYRIGKAQTDIQRKQTELQKQQCQIERYKIYQGLHRDIYKLCNLAKTTLPTIHDFFTLDCNLEFRRENIKSLMHQYEDIKGIIENDEADYALQFGSNDIMRDVVSYIYHVEYLLAYALNIKLPGIDNQKIFNPAQKFKNMQLSDNEVLLRISKIVKDEKFCMELGFFVKMKNLLFFEDNNILARIRSAYKAN